jgi:RDD family
VAAGACRSDRLVDRLALIVAGVLQAIGEAIGDTVGSVVFWISELAAAGVILAYFGAMLASGHTIGMRALDIHVRTGASGQPPTVGRAVLRGTLGLAFATATLNAYAYTQGTPFGELTTFEETAGRVAVVVMAVAAAGQLWMLVDPVGRTLWDRLTGLVVLEDMMPTEMPERLWAPWGP